MKGDAEYRHHPIGAATDQDHGEDIELEAFSGEGISINKELQYSQPRRKMSFWHGVGIGIGVTLLATLLVGILTGSFSHRDRCIGNATPANIPTGNNATLAKASRAPTAQATTAPPSNPPSATSAAAPIGDSLNSRVSAVNITRHLQKLLEIAAASGGNRAIGTIGYSRSVEYVRSALESSADYQISSQDFTHSAQTDSAPPSLEVTTPYWREFQLQTDEPTDDETNETGGCGEGYCFCTNKYGKNPECWDRDDCAGIDSEDIAVGMWFCAPEFVKMSGSGSGAVEAEVAVAANRGCEESDFVGTSFVGMVALIRRGTCTFQIMVQNAITAGAVAVVVYNSGDDDAHLGIVHGTLGNEVPIPVLATTYIIGHNIFTMPGTTLKLRVDSAEHTLHNSHLCAESNTAIHGGDEESVVVVGAHLGSVLAGPGINDNGSGAMTILEIALQLGQMLQVERVQLANKVRFCWWGAEEAEMRGSSHYISALNATNPTALSQIALALNFDMLGSPNFIRGVHDGAMGLEYGDQPPDVKQYVGHASEFVTELLVSYFDANNLAYDLTNSNGRTDYGPFLAFGIPTGGLTSGADGVKTEEERHRFGGLAGALHDPCYHSHCDTIENLSQETLSVMGAAASYGLERLLAAPELRAWLDTSTHNDHQLPWALEMQP